MLHSLLFTSLLYVGAAQAEPPAQPVVIDRLVAVVGDRVVAASDLELEAAIHGRDPSPLMPYFPPDGSHLARLIEMTLAREQAADVAIYAPSAEDVRLRMAALRATWDEPRDWAAFLTRISRTEEQLATALYKRMVAERYLMRNVIGTATNSSDNPDDRILAGASAYTAWSTAARARGSVRIISALSETSKQAD